MLAHIIFLSNVAHFVVPDEYKKWVSLFGTWRLSEVKSELIPIGGLCYWLTPPTLNSLSSDPYQALIYTICILSSSVLFSRLSINDEESMDNPKKLADDLTLGTHLTLAGVRSGEDSDAALKAEVARLCPIQAILGGLTLGSVCVISDILGIIGGSQGMLIATSIIREIYDLWEKAKKGA
jgi:protein transport protein SEC61 subunit alpha